MLGMADECVSGHRHCEAQLLVVWEPGQVGAEFQRSCQELNSVLMTSHWSYFQLLWLPVAGTQKELTPIGPDCVPGTTYVILSDAHDGRLQLPCPSGLLERGSKRFCNLCEVPHHQQVAMLELEPVYTTAEPTVMSRSHSSFCPVPPSLSTYLIHPQKFCFHQTVLNSSHNPLAEEDRGLSHR